MKRPQMNRIAAATLTALAIAYGPAVHAQAISIVDGDDGTLLRTNVSKTPTLPTEFANVQMAKFYVPAQNNSDVVLTTPLSYTRPNGSVVFTRTQAKPLISAFNDGPEVDPEWVNPVTGQVFDNAFSGHGKRDAFSSMSFDDGTTWKRVNLSQSGALVIGPVFVKDNSGKYVCDTAGLSGTAVQDLLKNPTVARCDYFYYGDNPLETPDPTPNDIDPVTGRYTIDTEHLVFEQVDGGGDVVNVSQFVVGNHVLVAWISRVCTGGVSPLDTIPAGTNPYDMLGYQGYVDYGLQKADGELGGSDLAAIREIGKVPFSCAWARRGRLVEDTATGGTKVQWWPAERLTAGVRDAWKIEVAGQENAGFAIVWQEDPDGLKPGSGEGPGEGWSGSTVNHKTDAWYTFLHLKDFDTPAGTPAMSVPVPITDNAKCPLNSGDQGKQWCYADNGRYVPGTEPGTGQWIMDGPNGLPDFCADGDLIYNSCVAEDGRFMEGQTGTSRPRVSLQSYCVGNNDPTTWAAQCTDFSQWSAWAGIAYEESKGKGDLVDENGVTLETGKNIRWATFDFQKPEPVRQHLMLNAPTKRYPPFGQWATKGGIYNGDGVVPDTVNPMQPVYLDHIVYRPNLFDVSVWNAPYFDTEIARRAAPFTQGVIGAAVNSTQGTTAIGLYKQGIVNQGASADIMFRRFALPEGYQAGSDNIFAYQNMACARWATATELGVLNNPEMVNVNGLPNPNYLDGLCLAPAHNVSATTPTRCDGNLTADPTGAGCGYMTTDPFTNKPTAVVRRMFDWTQTQGENGSIDNRDDESWANPWDVAKGHRGFLDGDFIMMQYAMAPNEIANAVGRDVYNLYVRRSFDGGQTWTTTPNAAPWTAIPGVVADGTTTCETYRGPVNGDVGIPGVTQRLPPVCTQYAAGAPEPARNVSLIRTKLPLPFNYPSRTVLDPRYSPTGGLLKHASTAFKLSGNALVVNDVVYTSPGGDLRNRSKFIMSYDDGDNRSVALGKEGEPLNMFYSQASNWGDDYTGTTATVPTGTFPVLQILNVAGTNNSESSISANPDGSFMYSIWNSWQYSDPTDYLDASYDSDEINQDAIFRRVMFLDGE